jgi:long-chain fatty acid transport protein
MRSIARFVPFMVLGLVLAPPGVPPALQAQDFSFHEVGTRAASLGGAFTAKADDITAIYYNPAGLALLPGLRVKTNLLASKRTVSAYLPQYDATFVSDPSEYLQNIFVSWRPAKRIGLGFAYYSPYNAQAKWLDPRWLYEDVSIMAGMKTHTLRAVAAAEILKGLSIGATLDYITVDVDWKHTIHFEPANYELEPEAAAVHSSYELSGHAWGFAAGVLWRPVRALRVGARFQAATTVDLQGSNSFSFSMASMYDYVPDPYMPLRSLADVLDDFYRGQLVTGRLTVPREIAGGIALTPVKPLSLYLDLQWDTWSGFGSWQFQSVKAEEDLAPPFTEVYQEFWGIRPNYRTQGEALVLRDTMKLKAGAEYRIGRWLAVRAGYSREQSSLETSDVSPLFPDLARNVYAIGGGYEGPLFSIYEEDRAIGELAIEVALRYSPARSLTSTLPGLELTYASERWSVGVGVGFNF